MTPLDMTDHMDILRPPVSDMRRALSKEAADKDDYIRELRLTQRMDWVDRTRPSARQAMKIKKKYHVRSQCYAQCSVTFLFVCPKRSILHSLSTVKHT